MNTFVNKFLRAAVPCVLLWMCTHICLQAQDPRTARLAFDDGNYFKAIELYSKLLDREPNEMEYNLKMGLSYLRTQIDPKLALDFLLTAEKQAKFPPEALLDIAEAFTFHLQYDMALTYLEKFEIEAKVNRKNRADFERRKANYEIAIELLKYPAEVSFRNLGPNVNSAYPDYHPFIDKDERTLIFTSRRKTRPGAQPEFDGYFPSNIYMSVRKNDEWSQATKLSDRINTPYDEQAVGITDSGDSLFFYIDHVNSFGNIYISTKKAGVYTDPKPLDYAVNTEYIESACSISRDGNTLIFSSDRPGGYGGLDIWMRRRLPNGEWGEPLNLGSEINTLFDEDFPTLSGDGKTLYFCSNGHPGMGKFDLFFSTWDALENTWSKPQNLGFPINTPSDEKSISYNEYGDRAYMTALRPDGLGDLDLYEVTYLSLREAMPAVFLVSVPQLSEDGKLKNSRIFVKNEAEDLVGEYAANNITGNFVLALYPGKYYMYLEADGYKPLREVFVVNNAHVRQDKNLKTLELNR